MYSKRDSERREGLAYPVAHAQANILQAHHHFNAWQYALWQHTFCTRPSCYRQSKALAAYLRRVSKLLLEGSSYCCGWALSADTPRRR